MHIIKTIASIPTKFCTVIKTTRFPLWAVQTRSSQIQDGGRPPSWKNRQIATSQQRFDRSTRYLVRWRTLFVLTLSTPKICTFLKSKMPAAAILKNRKMAISQQRFDWSTRNLARWCILAVLKTTASIPTKFCTVVKTSKCPSWVVRTHTTIQDGGRPPSWKNFLIGISRLRIDRFRPNLARRRSSALLSRRPLKFQIWKIQDGGGRHLEKSEISPYLGDGWSYRLEIWHADAVWLSRPFRFENRAQ